MFRLIVCVLALAVTWAAPVRAQAPVIDALDVSVSYAPVIVPGPSGAQLVLELHLTNFARGPVTLARVEVMGEGRTLAALEGEALVRALGVPSATPADNRHVIASGARVILFVNAAIGGDEPASVSHRITLERTRQDVAETVIVNAPAVRVDTRALPTLGPPLRGGPWAAIYHPEWERGHRRVFYAVDGKARLPGRFAIDWMRAGGDDGRGEEVLAVANGVVVAMRNDFPDEGSTLPATLANATGNYVAIDIGGGRYAFYEHLAQDVRVTVGQRVRRGQVIGTVGASGQVTQPHLHFHLADANSPLAAESLPYALRYRALGAYDTIEAFNAGGTWAEAGETRTPSFPSPMMVVEFPQ